jgi:adenine specific DNA methylase Mod
LPDYVLTWKNKRTEVEKVPLPFQKVETINLARANANTLAEYPTQDESRWKNKLIWGDNKYILASLLSEYSGKIKLIYIDPPFFTGTNMTMIIDIGDHEAVKEPSSLEEVAYRNMWKDGPSSFFQYIYDRLVIMKDLLSDDGSIWVRFDYHYSHYIKAIMDEIFGYENFRNEIIINRIKKSDSGANRFNTATDSLFFYTKTDNYLFNRIKKKLEVSKSERWHSMDSQGTGGPRTIFGKVLYPPPGRHWTFSQENIDRMIAEGRIRINAKSGKPEYKLEQTEEQILDSNWTDIPGYSFSTGYPTENAEQLLERVILSATNEGDLVADFFSGSGTTVAVAEKLGRRWIAADIGRFSIHTIRKRILDIPQSRPFEILNLGKYERQIWASENIGPTYKNYVDFILELYKAKPVNGMNNINGTIAGRAVHVGPVDYAVTREEILSAAEDAKRLGFRSLDILGWEWEMGLNETISKEVNEQFEISISLKLIPREVMDRRAVESGEIEFFELAALTATTIKNGNRIRVRLENFIIPNPEMIPNSIFSKITRWSDFIDYWSIDWNYDGEFHNEWQSFRTKRSRVLELESRDHIYEEGKHSIMVKVIDIFGNDTSTVLEVIV